MPLTLKPDYKPVFVVAFIAAYLTGCLFFCLAVIIEWKIDDELLFIVGMATMFAFIPSAMGGLIALVLLASFQLLRSWYFALAGACMPWIIMLVMFRRITEGSITMSILTLGGAVAGLVFWRISRGALMDSASHKFSDTDWLPPTK